MQGTHYSSAFLDTVVKRKEIMEKAGQEFTGNLLLKMIVVELEEWSNDDLFALYTEFECPVVTHEEMEERDFSEYDNPISLIRFAIGLQVEQLVKTFFPDAKNSTAFVETISYLRQTLDDLATYVQRRIESHVEPDREQEALLDLVEELFTVRNNAEEVLG
jgi:hypothetical protein